MAQEILEYPKDQLEIRYGILSKEQTNQGNGFISKDW